MLKIKGFVGLVAMAGVILWVTRFCKNSWIEYDKKLENTLELQEVKQTENHKTQDLSPINHIAKIRMPVILAYGTQESPEFKRQSQAFAEALKKQSKEVELHVLKRYNHFEIMIALGNPYNIPGEIMIKQMNID
jgi:arylformamidase